MSIVTGSKIKLREKKLTDARNDYSWETDTELAQLDAVPVLSIDFSQYLSTYSNELDCFFSSRQQFAVETLDGRHIGNCSYYSFNETKGETELGIMIGNRDYWNSGYGTDAVTTLVNHIFNETTINRIYLKTLESNLRAQRCFQKCSFVPYGHSVRDGYSFILMEIHREQWQERQTED